MARVPALKPLPGDSRLTAFPISRPGIWKYYLDARRAFWMPTEIDFSGDYNDYENSPKMTDPIRRTIDYIMAFFASLDKLVNINITEQFKKAFQIYEVDCFYDFQVAMENIHGETYSIQLEEIIRDKAKREHLLDSVKTIPIIKKMANLIYKCINDEMKLGERLLRMACVEGILFMGAFCIIYWLQELGLMKGLAHSNELISRDESLHTIFAIFLYVLLEPEHKISPAQIYEIFRETVDIAAEFATEAMPANMREMNAEQMKIYLECQADNLITLLSMPPLYKKRNPFHYMEKLNMANRSNFFERRVSEYQKLQQADDKEFELLDDF